MKEKISWQFKLFILYAVVGFIITYGSFFHAIQTDDIMVIPMIIGLVMLVSAIKIIDLIPIIVNENNEVIV